MNRFVLGLGSNINPRSNIRLAIDALSRHFTIGAASRLVQTKPLGYTRQSDFLNGALLLTSDRDRADVEALLRAVEHDLGRRRTANRNAPRTIDLDMVVWNNQLVDDDYYDRKFLRTAVREVLPGFYPHRCALPARHTSTP